MRNQLRQVLFLAIFWMLCTAFVFFVPRGASPAESESWTLSESPLPDQNSESVSWTLSTAEQDSDFKGILRIESGKITSPEYLQFTKAFTQKHGDEVQRFPQHIPSSSGSQVSAETPFDLALVAYDRFSEVEAQKIVFQEDLSPLFIPQLSGFIKEHQDFLPIGIAPAVMYSASWLQAGLEGLQIALENWEPRVADAPFSLGFREEAQFFDQNLLLAQQVQDFLTYNDIGSFQQWVEMRKGDTRIQEKMLDSLLSSKLCSATPLLCWVEKKLIGLAWWFSGEPDSPTKEGFSIHPYPYQYVGLPVRLYGFIIPKESKNRKKAEQFLLDYMDRAFLEGSKPLFPQMIPVFRNQFAERCGESACDLPSDFLILEDAQAKIQHFLKDPLLKKVLEKKVQPDLYLKHASL